MDEEPGGDLGHINSGLTYLGRGCKIKISSVAKKTCVRWEEKFGGGTPPPPTVELAYMFADMRIIENLSESKVDTSYKSLYAPSRFYGFGNRILFYSKSFLY